MIRAHRRTIHGPCKEYAARNNITIVDIDEFPARAVDLGVELPRLKERGAEYVVVPAPQALGVRSA